MDMIMSKGKRICKDCKGNGYLKNRDEYDRAMFDLLVGRGDR